MNIAKLAKEIKNGNLVIAPTDTIYGILADATNPTAVEKVFACKNRDKRKALILIADSIKMLRDYTQHLSRLEEEIIAKYLPGKLTILLPKNSKVSDEITGGSELVGIRIPDSQDLLGLIKLVGAPLISTSVNLSGSQAVSDLAKIEPALLKYVTYMVDEGVIKSEPSSIIKVEHGEIKALRDGEVARRILADYQN